jgi:hypothetical protein
MKENQKRKRKKKERKKKKEIRNKARTDQMRISKNKVSMATSMFSLALRRCLRGLCGLLGRVIHQMIVRTQLHIRSLLLQHIGEGVVISLIGRLIFPDLLLILFE